MSISRTEVGVCYRNGSGISTQYTLPMIAETSDYNSRRDVVGKQALAVTSHCHDARVAGWHGSVLAGARQT